MIPGREHGSVGRPHQCARQGVREQVTDEILAAPPSAIAGLTAEHDAKLEDALGIHTVAELGSNKYFALAGVLVALKGKTG